MLIIKNRLRKLNTLRNQILSVFLIVMLFVLAIVSFLVYNQVSALVKNQAETQMKQTAVEANGRMETLYKQVDTLSSQLATNQTVQQLMLSMVNGNGLDFSEKQTLARIIGNYQVYSNGIQSFELYSVDGNRIFPFDDTRLSDRIDRKWIERAELEKGKAVWAGKDPHNGNYSLAIRRVSLMDRWFSKGGYLVTRIDNSYFQLNHIHRGDERREFMMLLDQSLTPITSNYQGSLERVLAGDRIFASKGLCQIPADRQDPQ
ncbi:cache domain-containing protein [Laceyella putida]|uniref:Cache domain-containing protein n=1 Tax=Laceyella putida TaxID=110101 RepID=A0ABW2RFB3_9BACL